MVVSKESVEYLTTTAVQDIPQILGIAMFSMDPLLNKGRDSLDEINPVLSMASDLVVLILRGEKAISHSVPVPHTLGHTMYIQLVRSYRCVKYMILGVAYSTREWLHEHQRRLVLDHIAETAILCIVY